jgi:diacylglycerol O-acyltransferase
MMDDLRFDARMSGTEALVWALEDHDAALRSTIAVVAYLDRSPGIDALRARLERVSRLLPRFRDRVVPGVPMLTPPSWEPDPSFDLAFHVRSVQLSSAAGAAGVLRWAEPVVAEGLDRSRPLWQMTLVEGWPGEEAALILKLHHTFTDGLGAVKLAAVLFDFEPDAAEPDDMPPLAQSGVRSPLGRFLGEMTVELRRNMSLARRSLPVVTNGLLAAIGDPEAQAAATLEMIRSVAHLASPSVRPLSPILTSRSLRNRFEMLEAPLEGARRAAHAAGATVNDVFLAALLAGLRRYHERHGSRPDALRLGVPISTRRPETEHLMRNQFAPVRITVPLQETDPVARLRDVHQRIEIERAQPGLANVEQLAAVANRLPAVRTLLATTMASVDLVASNVPGVAVPLYLRGARVTRLVPFGPRNGAALNATVVSYDGTLQIGLNLDAVAIPDHNVLLDSLRKGLAETVGG